MQEHRPQPAEKPRGTSPNVKAALSPRARHRLLIYGVVLTVRPRVVARVGDPGGVRERLGCDLDADDAGLADEPTFVPLIYGCGDG